MVLYQSAMELRPGTQDLLEQLYRPSGIVNRLFGDNERLSAMEALAASGDVAAVPHLAPFLGRRTGDAVAAATAIDALLSGATDDELLLLDQAIRHDRDVWYGTSWFGLQPQDLSPPGSLKDLVALQVASFHWNGFVREQAVAGLAHATDGRELPFLLLRLNDWVPQVRAAAREAIEARLTPSRAVRFLRHVRLVTRLLSAGRVNHHDLLVALARLLVSTPAARSTISQMLTEATDRERRHLFRLATLSEDNIDALVLAALHSRDPFLQTIAVRRLPEVLTDSDLRAALDQAARGQASPVRREAILLLATRFPQESVSVLSAAVLDRSPAVRDLARFYLSKTGVHDFPSLYRGELTSQVSPTRLSAALDGLAEVGGPDDAAVAASFLDDASARVRRAAVRAIGRLDPEPHLPMLLRALGDPVRSVSAAARTALRPHASQVGMTSLWVQFESAPSPHTRRNAFELLAALPKWESVQALLRVVSGRSDFNELATDYLARWNARYNLSATMPSRDRLHAASAALDAAANRLPPRLAAELRFVFDSVAQAIRA